MILLKRNTKTMEIRIKYRNCSKLSVAHAGRGHVKKLYTAMFDFLTLRV
jgi:hypothetical protein